MSRSPDTCQVQKLLPCFVFLFYPVLVHAIPPPPVQFTADCVARTYASDQFVCADAELLELDRLLSAHIAQRRKTSPDDGEVDEDQDWFRRSRLCAFESDHRECLLSAYCLRLALLNQTRGSEPLPCDTPVSNYAAASSISKSGFAASQKSMESLPGREIELWGYVDHQNIYADDSAKQILGDWWAGYGPEATTWRFNLKASTDDDVGQSFPVYVPNDILRDDVLRLFLRDAAKNRPTKVYLKGNITTFDAPANFQTFRGLSMQLQSSRDIRLQKFEPE